MLIARPLLKSQQSHPQKLLTKMLMKHEVFSLLSRKVYVLSKLDASKMDQKW